MIRVDGQSSPQPEWLAKSKTRPPLWRRVTALFTLSFVSIVAGLVLAVLLGLSALTLLFLIERAIAT